MPWSPAEIALLWIGYVCGGLLAALYIGLIASTVLRVEPRHPYREDIPNSWE